jgi:hypothetical protein
LIQSRAILLREDEEKKEATAYMTLMAVEDMDLVKESQSSGELGPGRYVHLYFDNKGRVLAIQLTGFEMADDLKELIAAEDVLPEVLKQ